MTFLPKCWVCLKILERIGLHYGGVSCDACRVFFRRMVVKKEAAICKSKGYCLVPNADGLTCGPCRYETSNHNPMDVKSFCYRAGMCPERVKEDMKSEREANSPSKSMDHEQNREEMNKTKQEYKYLSYRHNKVGTWYGTI